MILVTGGTGLVGAHLLLALAENDSPIRALFREEKSIQKTKLLFQLYQKENLFSKIEWVQADVIDVPSLEPAFQNATHVYHCAALISFDPKDENKLRKTNIEGTANIVNFCLAHKVTKLCHVSSIAALGDLAQNEKELSEASEWNPEAEHSDYAISKYGAEMEIWRGQQEGLQVVIVNPGVILGAGFWEQGSGEYFSRVKKGISFYTNGTTAYVGVSDVVKAMIRLMQSTISGERFVVISENLTFKNVIFEIADSLHVKRPSREAKFWLLAISWRMDWLLSTLFGTKRKLSKYSAHSLQSKEIISNQKIKNALNFEFQSMTDVIKEIVSLQK